MVEFASGSTTLNIRVSNPDRVLFPQPGITKRQLMDYYATVSPVLLPHYQNRMLTIKRWPHGIEGMAFYQKHTKEIQATNEESRIQVNSVRGLLQWVAMGVIEWHVPLGPARDPHRHDWAIFDLDPHQVRWEKVAEATGIMGRLLDMLDIPYVLKTSGRHGMHIYIKIEPEPDYKVTAACQLIARIAQATYPHLLTLERLKKNRGNRVYIDYLQNSGQRTMAGVYSVRAVPWASVSCPITLDEIGQEPAWWTMNRVIDRIKHDGDQFAVHHPGIPLTRHLSERGLSQEKLFIRRPGL